MMVEKNGLERKIKPIKELLTQGQIHLISRETTFRVENNLWIRCH